jgi:hypothetical protein
LTPISRHSNHTFYTNVSNVSITASVTKCTNSKKLFDIGAEFVHSNDIVAQIFRRIKCVKCQVCVSDASSLKKRIVEKHISVQMNGRYGTQNFVPRNGPHNKILTQ